MSSRDYSKFLISAGAPANSQLGDEYYDPTTGILYKNIAIGGNTIGYQQIPVSVDGTLNFAGNVAITGALTVNGKSLITTDVSNNLVLTGTTASTSTTTGALQVAGGVGIGKDLFVGGNINVNGSINLTASSNFTDFTANTGTFQTVVINSTASTTSTNTGALKVAGGVGVGGGLFVGGNVTATSLVAGGNNPGAGVLTIAQNGITMGYASSNFMYFLALDMGSSFSNLFLSLKSTGLTVYSNSSSTSTTTGALQVAGGVGIGGDLFVGGTVTATVLRTLSSAIALGANTNLASSSVAIGNGAGAGSNAVAIGTTAGVSQGASAVAIGNGAGNNAQQGGGVAVGQASGFSSQGTYAVAIGGLAGYTSQGAYSVAIGYYAGQTSQVSGSIIISATSTNQIVTASNQGLYIYPVRADATSSATTYGVYYNPVTREITTATAATGGSFTGGSVANITTFASTVTITSIAASTSTNTGALQVAGGVGIGGSLYVGGTVTATVLRQTDSAFQPIAGNAVGTLGIAIGSSAGSGVNSIGIGANAGAGTQGAGSVAIGYNAGNSAQGAYSVAIGYGAGAVSQTTGSVIISATSTNYIQTATNQGLYITPIRADATSSATAFSVYYNPVTRELTTSTAATGGGLASPYSGIFTITNTTVSTSATTGALQVAGGVGVGGSLYAGNIYSNGSLLSTAGAGNASTIQYFTTFVGTATTFNFATGTTATISGNVVTIQATGGGGSAIPVLNDTSTSITYYPALSSITTGTLSTATISSTKLYYTANNGTLNATIFNSLSDITQKANISVISNGLEIVDGLRGVTFDWVDGSGSSAGLVAQDVEKWLPQLVNTGPDGVKNLNYSGIIGVLVEAVKNLSQRVNDLEAGK